MDYCKKCKNFRCNAAGTERTTECEDYMPHLPTKGDQIRAMTDEDLAVVIAWPYLASPPWCSEHTTCPYISEDPTPCDKCALDWLKQEVKE